jgi:thiamine transport system permease protein
MKRLLVLLPLIFLAIFFCYPLASITLRGLAPEGVLDLSVFGKIIGSEFYRETLWFTFWQAAVSTILTLLAAFPAAYVMARYTFRGKSLISALTLVPFVMPTVIVAAGFMALIGPRLSLLSDTLLSCQSQQAFQVFQPSVDRACKDRSWK